MADMCEFPRLPEFFDVDSMVDDSLTNTCTLFEENMVDDTFPEPSLFDPDNCLSSVVQVQKTQEKSPFHESDSGVSEVSDFCGGSPSRESAVMLDEMLDNMKTTSFLLDSDPDLELMNYLADNSSGGEKSEAAQSTICKTQSGLQTRMSTRSQSAAVLNAPKTQTSKAGASSGNEPPKKGVPRVVLRGRRSLTGASGANQSPAKSGSGSSVSESDDSDIEVDGGAGKASCPVPKGSVRVSRPGSTLPSSSASTSTNCNVTSVKIVRVTNVGKTSSPEEDINKALEDRNRKNAEIAKANRQKKKAYVENLEKEVEEGRQKIDQLEMQLNDVEEERDACNREIHYLRSVLANQSALAGLLKNIPNVSGATLSAPSSRKRVTELDHSYNTSKKSRASQPQSTAGVCLHVDNDNVSLEFCHHCAEKSARSSQS